MNPTPLTQQQLFDNALFGIRKHGQSIKANSIGCLYSAGEGKKCAIGHSIPDDILELISKLGLNGSTFYDMRYGLSVRREDSLAVAFIDLFSDVSPLFVKELQNIHDNEFSIFETQMKMLANRYGLNYQELDV